MAKPRYSARPGRPTPAETGTVATGIVPVQRAPIPLGRRFLQICISAAAEALTQEGLTPAQLGVLVTLSPVTGQPDMDQNGVAARLGIDRARVSQLLDEIDAMGLVDRRVNGADRRARLLRLTPRGERLRARLQPASIANQMRVFASLTPRERELLLDLLVRVVESNSNLTRPGAGGRKQGSRQSTANKSRPLPSNNI
jgi:DNA-binding MarR family transcriptional regulator